MTRPPVSLARRAAPLVEALIEDAPALRLGVSSDASGARVVDAGIGVRGGLEAGRRIAEICLGGLGRVTLAADAAAGDWPWRVTVSTDQPVAACLAAQYAGWRLVEGDFFALASGPGRAQAAVEPLFAELGHRESFERAALVLEVDRPPPSRLLAEVAERCGVAPDGLTVILTPTTSLAGSVQIVARSLEVALHKAHTLGFPLQDIVDGMGVAPLPPPAPDFVAAMGRTNDAILYGGTVLLAVTGAETAARALADGLPSVGAREYGRPFAEIFAAYDGDFYKIDPLLFSPGRVTVTALETGRSFARGRLDPAILRRSFALDGV